jgi:hypothetical protein
MALMYSLKKLFGIKEKLTTKTVSLFLNDLDGEKYAELIIAGYPIEMDEEFILGQSIDWERVPDWRKDQIDEDRKLEVTWDQIKGYLITGG